VEVRRSTRRRRTVSAYRDGQTVVVLLPARMSKAEEKRWVTRMLERLAARERPRGEGELLSRARDLSGRYLDGRAVPTSVRWVGNQHQRWGSCTVPAGTIRLSDRLRRLPDYVVDYVLVHELAHLIEPDHGERFWRWVDRYPHSARARGFLEGVAYAPAVSPSGGSKSGADSPAR
jgi:predicted metal-dependent hydrolase